MSKVLNSTLRSVFKSPSEALYDASGQRFSALALAEEHADFKKYYDRFEQLIERLMKGGLTDDEVKETAFELDALHGDLLTDGTSHVFDAVARSWLASLGLLPSDNEDSEGGAS